MCNSNSILKLINTVEPREKNFNPPPRFCNLFTLFTKRNSSSQHDFLILYHAGPKGLENTDSNTIENAHPTTLTKKVQGDDYKSSVGVLHRFSMVAFMIYWRPPPHFNFFSWCHFFQGPSEFFPLGKSDSIFCQGVGVTPKKCLSFVCMIYTHSQMNNRQPFIYTI